MPEVVVVDCVEGSSAWTSFVSSRPTFAVSSRSGSVTGETSSVRVSVVSSAGVGTGSVTDGDGWAWSVTEDEGLAESVAGGRVGTGSVAGGAV